MSKTLSTEKKYHYYETSVQNPEGEVDTLRSLYRELRGKEAKVLREDFCGTGAVMCEWSKQGHDFKAFGIDLDPEPVEYGQEKHYKKLNDDQKSRVQYIMGDVFDTKTEKADLVIALNFSYFIFKKRKRLIEYFKSVREQMADDGVFVIDLFGGPESMMPLEEETEHSTFTYFWDCDHYNPITHECKFFIHFKPHNSKKHKRVFEYDWRMWGYAELRDILEDAGFSKTVPFWEGDDDDSDSGNGEFYATESIDNCEAWVGYIAALK